MKKTNKKKDKIKNKIEKQIPEHSLTIMIIIFLCAVIIVMVLNIDIKKPQTCTETCTLQILNYTNATHEAEMLIARWECLNNAVSISRDNATINRYVNSCIGNVNANPQIYSNKISIHTQQLCEAICSDNIRR